LAGEIYLKASQALQESTLPLSIVNQIESVLAKRIVSVHLYLEFNASQPDSSSLRRRGVWTSAGALTIYARARSASVAGSCIK
jgi:hypothetical protein